MNELPLDAEGLGALTDLEDVWAVAPLLDALEEDTDILLFIGPGCPVCPHQVRSVATVAMANPRIAVEIVDATPHPELTEQFSVTAVPTTVVNDELILVGFLTARDLARRIMEQHGPNAEELIFSTLLDAGRHTEAAHRLADGRAADAFMALWERSTFERRMGLMLVAEEVLETQPEGLDPLVPRLIAGLEGQGPLTGDEARKGDTADLLGRIGHPDARPALERLTDDANEQVAEAARASLAQLEGR